jgi:hypothetical protein
MRPKKIPEDALRNLGWANPSDRVVLPPATGRFRSCEDGEQVTTDAVDALRL